jgi:hypothetical protein
MKIKVNIFLLALAMSLTSNGQNRFFTKSGVISFKAGTAVENIDGLNKSVTSVFDAATGQIEFAVLVKGFEFKRGLMQEHFNENYMESEKFPKAVFKGKSDNIKTIDFKKDGSYPTIVKGTLDIHGVKKEVEVSGVIHVLNGITSSVADFKILLSDYHIEIPGAVKDKISPTVEIHTECTYKPMN